MVVDRTRTNKVALETTTPDGVALETTTMALEAQLIRLGEVKLGNRKWHPLPPWKRPR